MQRALLGSRVPSLSPSYDSSLASDVPCLHARKLEARLLTEIAIAASLLRYPHLGIAGQEITLEIYPATHVRQPDSMRRSATRT